MKIMLTGGTSIIGRRVASSLREEGHDVTQVGRNEVLRWSLGETVPTDSQWDMLIHLAHDRSRSLEQSEIDSSKIIASFPGKIIYISTMSAHRNSHSNYGQCKFLAENLFFAAGACVLKVGMVIDDDAEGVYGKMRELVRRFWFIPLPLLGKPTFYVSNLSDLVSEINSKVIEHSNAYIRASSEDAITLRKLVKRLCQDDGKRRILVPVPKHPLHLVILIVYKFFPSLSLLDSYFSLMEEMPREIFASFQKPSTNFTSFSFRPRV
jgi:hypothetical protein